MTMPRMKMLFHVYIDGKCYIYPAYLQVVYGDYELLLDNKQRKGEGREDSQLCLIRRNEIAN